MSDLHASFALPTVKKAAFFIPYFWAPHLETDLELMHEHFSRGDEVTVFVCHGELPTCFSNVSHEQHVCTLCSNRRRNGFHLTGLGEHVDIRNFLNIRESDRSMIDSFRGVAVHSVSELFSVKVENCYLGKAIYNELVCIQGDNEPDLDSARDFITKAIESGALVYYSFKNHFSERKPDVFYTFNGRFAVSQAAIDAAIACDVLYAVHDRAAGVMGRYTLVCNDSLNSLNLWKTRIEKTWADCDKSDSERNTIGSKWFNDRTTSQKQSWFSFTAEQDQTLPSNFDHNIDNIVIFSSTDWEFAGLDDYQLPFYSTQSEALIRLATDLEPVPQLKVYLRVHPQLKGKDNAQTRFIYEKLDGQFRNFEVIRPDSKISTYLLMKNASLAVTFGSTTGIEAVYQRIPSLLLGRSVYEDLDVCTIVTSHGEALDFIRQRRFKLTDDELDRRYQNSLKYGFMQETSGTSYQLFDQTDVFEMRFKGEGKRGEVVSYDSPDVTSGLIQEISRRQELSMDGQFNPLTHTTKELASALQRCVEERAHLIEEIASLKEETCSHKKAHKLHWFSQWKGRVERSLRRLLSS